MKFFLDINAYEISTAQQKGFNRTTGVVYPKPKAKQTKKMLTKAIAPHAPEEPLKGVLQLTVKYLYPWRKSESKANKSKERILKDTSPDTDNLNKMLKDIMEEQGFFKNDARVAIEHIEKWWCDEPTGVIVELVGAEDVRLER